MFVESGLIVLFSLFMLMGLYPVVVCGKDQKSGEIASSAKTADKEHEETEEESEEENEEIE